MASAAAIGVNRPRSQCRLPEHFCNSVHTIVHADATGFRTVRAASIVSIMGGRIVTGGSCVLQSPIPDWDGRHICVALGGVTGITGGQGMRKLKAMRRSEQADYQRAYRIQQKALRKPSRDDVARVALHLMIGEALKHNEDGKLTEWCAVLVIRLADQGFNRDAAHRRVDQLIERYADGWDFQRKPHLICPRAD
jgi:hypothetical protein